MLLCLVAVAIGLAWVALFSKRDAVHRGSPVSPETRSAASPASLPPAPPSAGSENAAESLLASARQAIDSGQFPSAESQAREALRFAKSNSLEAAEAMDVVVAALHKQGRYNEPGTRDLAEQALRIKESILPPEDPRLDPSLKNLGNQMQLQADYDDALVLFERLLELRERNDGRRSSRAAGAHDALGIVLRQKGDYEAAKQEFERSLEIRKALPWNADRSYSLHYLGVVHQDLGQYLRARRYYEQALAIRIRAHGDSATDVAETMSTLADVQANLGQYTEARRNYEHALGIREKIGKPFKAAETLDNLAQLLRTLGDYEAARAHCERALNIRLQSLGPRDPFVASNMCDLAYLELLTGEYAKALARFDWGLQILESSLGELHPSVADHLSDLVDGLLAIGDESEARRLGERTLSIQMKAFGKRHASVGRTLHRLGDIELAAGNPSAAIARLEESLSILEDAVGREHEEVARVRLDLAAAFARSGNPERASDLFDAALATLDRTLGTNHPASAEGRRALAAATFAGGNASRARSLYEDAARSLESSLGPDAAPLRLVLGELAEVLAWSGDSEGALAAALRSEGIARDHLRLTSRALPERQALHYASMRGRGLDVALSIAAAQGLASRRDYSAIWDALVRSRLLVLDEMAARQRAVVTSSDPETERLEAEFVTARQRVANLAVRGPGSTSVDEHLRLVATASREAEARVRALAQRSQQFREQQRRDRVGGAEVLAALPAGSALVSLARYERFEISTGAHVPTERPKDPAWSYVAFITVPGDQAPRVVPLGDAASIDALVERWRKSIATSRAPNHGGLRESEIECLDAGESLRRAIWDPVAASLRGAQQVFLVPDGSLQLVDFSLLPDGRNGFLLESGPLFRVLTTERDLATPRHPAGRGLLVLGDPDFDAPLSGAVSMPRSAVSVKAIQASGDSDRIDQIRAGEFTSRFSPLPASAHEVEDLVAIWRQGPGRRSGAGECLQLTGSAACEGTFKREAPGRRILHLAVHGFFLRGNSGGAPHDTRGMNAMVPNRADAMSQVSNPLLRAGLALAGANRSAEAKLDQEDGVLLAEEVAALDLEGVDLVVLSACDTGLGELQASEGLLGLRRAFMIAGAQTVVASLWPVRDETARRWMRSFYKARLLEGLDAAAAARQAHRDCLRWQRETRSSIHPMFWAGFLVTGGPDWPQGELPRGIENHAVSQR